MRIAAPSEKPTAFGKTPPRILVVDDDDTVSRMLSRALERLGCVVLTADGLATVRERCASRPLLDLALVDVNLADCDGEQVIAELDSIYGGAPLQVIVMSGSTYEGRLGPRLAAVVEKPFAITELMQTVKDVLATGRAPR